MLKIIKIGVGLNALCLLGGYINSKKKPLSEADKKEFIQKQDMKQFNKEFEIFQTKYNNFTNVQTLSRNENLEKISKEEYDLLIIGGGCSGAGVLLEAYERGLKCALIEGNDFASGTSSRSTKLIHGGIRYLQDVFTPGSGHHYEKLKLVFEALQERDFLINSAPFMNNIVEIKIPFRNFFWMDYYFMGVFVYHFLYAIQNFPSIINTFPWPKLYPGTNHTSFYEGQMFDSRQCLLSILTCAQNTYKLNDQGSTCLNYTLFKEYIHDSHGKIIGVKAYDKINKKEFNIYANCIVNCTGIFADSNLDKEDSLVGKLITTSKGAHVVVDKELFYKRGISTGYMLPNTSDGRILFVLPYQRNYFLVGTTDNEIDKTAETYAEDVDVAYIFNELKNTMGFSNEELKDSIRSTWAGLRPLVRAPNKNGEVTKSLARNHIVRYDHHTGLVSLLGGKWTTYRKMGQDVIEVVAKNKLIPGIKEKSMISGHVKLSGGINPDNVQDNLINYDKEKEFYLKFSKYLSDKYSIGENLAESLIFKYGVNSLKILELDRNVNTKDRYLLEDEKNPILTAELLYSVKHELAVKPNDFICRRTGLAFIDSKSAENMIEKVAKLMGKEFRWSNDHIKKEIEESKKNFKYFI